jgi:HEAT repeat protein
MEHQDEWNAQRIADALYSFGREAVPEMARYLQGTGRYRPLVARTLGLIGDIRAEGSLIQALSSSDADLRMRAAAALGRAGTPRAVPSLLELLADKQWEVRAQAASALGRRTDRQAIPWLRRALSDQSWWVRHNAAAALVEVPGGSEALRSSLGHPDPYARDAAAAVLLSSGVAGEAVEALRSTEVTDRLAAEDLISSLVQAGKAEFFLVAGLNPEYVDALRMRV